jgi:hypothetical protein
MKTLSGIVLFVLLGALVNAQQTPVDRPTVSGKIMAETSVMSEKIIKGSPFSADAVNESVQVLADGNRIVHSSTNKLYRNSEGRFRREISGGSAGSFSSFYTVGPGITILDPVGGYRYLLDAHLKTARVGALTGVYSIGGTVAVPPSPRPAPVTKVEPAAQAAIVAEKLRAAELRATTIDPVVEEKMKAELKQAAVAVEQLKGELKAAAPMALITTTEPSGVVSAYQGSLLQTPGFKTKYESRTEDLGVQTIEGVEAVGTRTITTIPAGAIGNERPIEMVYEKWYSHDLQLVILSKHSDPRFGDQTYRLTNIVRSEPDPALFELPSGYKVISDKIAPYKISTAGSAQGAVWTKASGSGTTTARPAKP